ncbi:MAG: 23S rRNA (pseudouridine(1915)-N(3))-methyltransferase RlmH [Acidobacteria bacterium]|nr:23S rRNA (pseudouridine(1915)-N(3))-methyltransferase RlmH [Acidobacteriota bacterium]
MKVHLYYIGKPRSREANAMAEDYVERAQRFARVEMREIHPRRFDPWQRHPAASKILLDPAGRAMDSARIAAFFEKAEREGRDLVFVVGGADGLPETWRTRADLLLSLSPMTLPHELARVLVAEQIYRAFATLRGHPYPR